MLKRLSAMLRALCGGARRPLPSSPESRLGAIGEQAAVDYLRARGYRILARNYRVLQGELDVVAFRDGAIAFVEVRAQTEPAQVDAVFTITPRKQRRIEKAARAYLAAHAAPAGAEPALRFDVVTVHYDQHGGPPRIDHVEGAFEAGPGAFT